MAQRVQAKAIEALCEVLGGDKDFVMSLAKIYRTQGEEFLAAIAAGASSHELADLAHRLAGSSSRLGVADFVGVTLALESKLRDGRPHGTELDAVVVALPEIMDSFDSAAGGLAD